MIRDIDWRASPATTRPPNLFLLPNGNTLGSAGGVVGGAQVGYNYQFNQFVDWRRDRLPGQQHQRQRQQRSSDALPDRLQQPGQQLPDAIGAVTGANVNLSWFGTVRGRVGYLVTPTLLLYGTAGFAYGQVNAFGFSNTPTGWTAGGGVEWMFAPHWTAKLEYLYVDLSSNGATGGLGFNYGYYFHPQFNVVRVGVNYLFNFAAPAPVVAKY